MTVFDKVMRTSRFITKEDCYHIVNGVIALTVFGTYAAQVANGEDVDGSEYVFDFVLHAAEAFCPKGNSWIDSLFAGINCAREAQIIIRLMSGDSAFELPVNLVDSGVHLINTFYRAGSGLFGAPSENGVKSRPSSDERGPEAENDAWGWMSCWGGWGGN